MSTAYQVIARRWRPRQFDELVGQEHIVRTLSNAIEQDRIAHAYLFVGPRGTGKTSTARIFAKALNAEGGPNVKPDNENALSQSIMNGSCMDVVEIDGASNNGVQQIKDLIEDCQYAPTQSNFKIYIIDEVHMLTTQAFNALLKTLEEPPAHVKFIFATTESHKVLPTIVSRCQRFEFRPISDEHIIERLSLIAEKEGIEIDDEAKASIARLANGGMRDAQSIFDQLISFCGKNISLDNVLDVYGLVSTADITTLATAMVAADYTKVISMTDKWVNEGKDLYRLLLDIQSVIRRALLDAIQQNGKSENLGKVMSTESYMRMLDVLHAGEKNVRTGLSERVNFEITLLKAVEQSRSRAIDSVINEISRIAADLPDDSNKKKITEAVVEKPATAIKPEVKAEPEIMIKEPAPQEIKPEDLIANTGNAELDEAVQQLPENTRKILKEKYRADYVKVVPIKNDEWRKD